MTMKFFKYALVAFAMAPLSSQAGQVSVDNPFGGVVIVPSAPATLVVVPSISTPGVVAPTVASTSSSSIPSSNSASGSTTISVSVAATMSPPAGLTPQQAATATKLINKIIAQNPNMTVSERAGYDAQLATLAAVN